MKPEIRPAISQQDRQNVFRFRYDTYVEEMGRYRSAADHVAREFCEPEDATARIFIATQGDRTVGAMRLNWGGDAPLCPRQIEQYGLAPFLDAIPREQVIVGERFMVAPDHRGTDLIFRLFKTYLGFVNENRVQVMFGDCEPHLLNLYIGMGFRTYSARNVNSPQTGYLIPLVMVPEDLAYMRAIGSPILPLLRDFGTQSRVPANLEDLLSGGGGVISQTLTGSRDYAADIADAFRIAENPVHLFDGFSAGERDLCLKKSNVIECRPGDHLIKKGNVAQNMFAVLSGMLEVRIGERVINVCVSGDVVGEMAFLLQSPRSADVYVAGEGTRVLSLSESNLKKLSGEDPALAAKLLLNLSKLLCHKLLRSG